MAVGLEAAALAVFMLAPPPAAPIPPAIVQLKVLAPPAPKPLVKPALPKPVPPPPVPVPVVPQRVPPPPPPRPHAAHHVLQHVVHTPPPMPVPPQPTPPAPQPAAPPPSPVAADTAMSRYTGLLRALVLQNLQVPQELIESGEAANCTLEFTLAPDGTLLSVQVLTSSGMSIADQAAMDALRASRLPAFLPGMPTGAHIFILPVHLAGDSE